MDMLTASIEAYGLVAVVLVVLLKSAGLPIPVPNDALLLLGAVWVADGRQPFWLVFPLLLAALVAGNLLQYWAVGAPARRLLDRFGPRYGLTPRRLSHVAGMIERGGVIGFSLGVLTPGLRSLAVVAAGLSRLPLRILVPGLLLGNGAFLIVHFLLALVGLAAVGTLLTRVPTPGLIGVALIGVGFGGWLAIRAWRRHQPLTRQTIAEAAGAWYEASCPVCLLLGALVIPNDHTHNHDRERTGDASLQSSP